MKKKLSIVHIASESAPFVKTGGLADVVLALAKEFSSQKHNVSVILPFYSAIKIKDLSIDTALMSMCVSLGEGEEWCAVKSLKYENVNFYFIEHNNFFEREGIYHDNAYNDYQDNPLRFGFFSRASLQFLIDGNIDVDIIHIHDWQTAPVAVYLKTWFWNNQKLGKIPVVLTIHNISYQGVYSNYFYNKLGFNKDLFIPNIFEDHGRMNFLKAGIYFSDVVNTVSPTHAAEIKAPFGGFGLSPYINDKQDAFTGILNGVDYSHWSPDIDEFIPAKYDLNNLSGKKICKKELQKKLNLEIDDHVAIIGVVGRFAHQKGFDLIKDSIENILNDMHVQFAILGKGDGQLENYFGTLPAKYPKKTGSFIGFNNELAHLIEAGSDFFLMPSLYEPCGLNQMYSLKYGTLPIVRATGGLNDTVENYNEQTGEGTGFVFYDPTPTALYYTVGWAISTYYDRPQHMKKMIKTAMKKDFSWKKSAKEYKKLYEKAFEYKKKYDESFL